MGRQPTHEAVAATGRFEVFSVDQRDAIDARRMAQWAHAVAPPGKPQHLMLLIAEVKAIVPARYGFKAVIKHVPDQTFALDEQIYRRLSRRFELELSLWGAADNLHMVMIATFGVSTAGVPAISELSLMPVTAQWLPIEDSFEYQLIERLVRAGRSFAKALRYNLRVGEPLAAAILTDVGDTPVLLWIEHQRADAERQDVAIKDLESVNLTPPWVWRPTQDSVPPLPIADR